MIMLYTRDSALHDFAGDDAHRCYLIHRNQPPIVHRSGAMLWKRIRVLARHATRHIRGMLAALRVALVADKMRRAHRELSRVGFRDPGLKAPHAGHRRWS